MISNPFATGQRPEVMRRLVLVLQSVPGLRFTVVFTQFPGHAEKLCRGLTREDFDALIAVGGDGTINEVINGLLAGVPEGTDPDPQAYPALAVLPAGSANVFARALGFPQDLQLAARKLAEVLTREDRRSIYLGRWSATGRPQAAGVEPAYRGHAHPGGVAKGATPAVKAVSRWFAVNCGCGIDADVIARMERARSRGFSATPLRYLSTSIVAWNRTRRDPPRIEVAARTFAGADIGLDEVPIFFASNTNPWTFLGPLPVLTNPQNSFDRGFGLFSLTHLDGVGGVAGMLHLLGMGHSRWFERFIKKCTVLIDDVASVCMRTPRPRHFRVDGELAGVFREVRLRTAQDAIEVFAPREEVRWADRTLAQVVRDFVRWS